MTKTKARNAGEGTLRPLVRCQAWKWCQSKDCSAKTPHYLGYSCALGQCGCVQDDVECKPVRTPNTGADRT